MRREQSVQAKKNNVEEMTHAPVRRLVTHLAIPSIVIMIITNIYNLADTAFVSQLGNSASGAVGIVFGFMAIIQAFGFMFGQGAGSMAARYIGEQKFVQVNRTATTGIVFSFLAGCLITVFGLIFRDELTVFLGSTPTIKPYADIYITYILASCPAMTSSITMNVVLRYEGKASLGAVGMLSGAILNIVGDAFFMNVLHMEIGGAGLSTFLCQIISFVILLWMFLSGRTISKLSLSALSFKRKPGLEIMESGFPSLVRQSFGSITTVILNVQAAVYGDEAVAAMSIVSRIVFFVIAVSTGIGHGFQPVSAINYGAGKYKRVKEAYRFTTVVAECIAAAFVVVLLWKTEPVLALFRDDSTVIAMGSRTLRWQSVALLFVPICSCTEMLLQSTGQKLSTTILSAMRSGIYFIPVLLILSKLRGLAGVQEAQAVAFILAGVSAVPFLIAYFHRLDRMEKDRIQRENRRE